MEWLNIILDHVSKYKLENISRIEREYLNQYDTDNSKALEDVLNERVAYYQKAVDYDVNDIFFYQDDVWEKITEVDLKDTRLCLLWEIILDDDFDTFSKIYNIPTMVLSFEWSRMDDKFKSKFEDYWKSYYNFNI